MSNYIIHREEDEDYLEHFGVRGMHWGVRRYQNEDGSYKPGADGRYAPDGQPGVNKKRSGGGSSASGTSKPKNSKKSEGEEEDEEISRRADALQKKNPNMSRKDAESAAEDEMIKEASEERKKQGKYGLLDKLSDKIGEAADRKEAERQKKKEEKLAKQREAEEFWEKNSSKLPKRYIKTAAERQAEKKKKEAEKKKKQEEQLSKDSYKKVIARNLLRGAGIWAGSTVAANVAAGATGDRDFGIKVGRGLNAGASLANNVHSVVEAKRLHDYRKQKNARHSDYSEYDYELYHHGILGMHWGIRRFQNEDGTLTAAGKKRYRTDEDLNKYGKTRKEVIDRLSKGAEKLATKSDEYYDKSQYSKEEKAFKRMQAQKAYENRDDENYKNKDDFSSYKSKLKEFDVYDEDNDKDYQMSKKLSDKANELAIDARRLGKDYVRNNKIMGTTLAALAGGYAGLKIADANGLSGKKFVASMLASSIASVAVANVATGKLSNHIQNKTEKKYGFR